MEFDRKHTSRDREGKTVPSLSLEVCFAGTEMTGNSLGWGTRQVKQTNKKKLYILYILYLQHEFNLLSMDQNRPTPLHCLNKVFILPVGRTTLSFCQRIDKE